MLSDVPDLACEVCGIELHYAGRGRKPRYCADHKPSNKTASKSPTKRGRKPVKSREGLQTFGSLVWGMAGYNVSITAGTPGQVAVGNVMQLQAADAGKRLARLLGPTLDRMGWLDRISSGGPAGDIAALVLPPMLAGVIASNEAIREPLMPLLSMMLRPIAESLVEQQQAQAEAMSKFTEADENINNAVQSIFSQIFGEDENSEESNG